MHQRNVSRHRGWLALALGAVLVVGIAGSGWTRLHQPVGHAPAPITRSPLPASSRVSPRVAPLPPTPAGNTPLPAPPPASGGASPGVAPLPPLAAVGNAQASGAGDGAAPPAPLTVLAPGAPADSAILPPVPAGAAVVIQRVATARPYVAITVDDFYTANYQWLTALHQLQAANALHAPLTLCPAGSGLVAYAHKAPAQAQAIKQLVAAGSYEFCDHTYSHPVMPTLSMAAQTQEMLKGAAVIRAFFGRSPIPVFRPPFGSWDASTQRAAAAAGFPRIVSWSVDTGDAVGRERPAAWLVAKAARARAGDIILLHANRRSSAGALPQIIQRLRAKGLEPVLLSTLLARGTPVYATHPPASRARPPHPQPRLPSLTPTAQATPAAGG